MVKRLMLLAAHAKQKQTQTLMSVARTSLITTNNNKNNISRRCLSSVSPLFRRDNDIDNEGDDDNDKDGGVRVGRVEADDMNHHQLRRHQPRSPLLNKKQQQQQPIQIQSPPVLDKFLQDQQQQQQPTEESSSQAVTVSFNTPATDITTFVSPSEIKYTDDATIPITSRLHMVKPGEDDVPRGIWPVFRLMVSCVNK